MKNTYSNNKGTKYDTGKLRYDLFPPECLQEVVKILTFGAEKYGTGNWQNDLEEDRIYAAMMRHVEAWRMGEDMDEESGNPHLAHAMCNIIFLLWYNLKKDEIQN